MMLNDGQAAAVWNRDHYKQANIDKNDPHHLECLNALNTYLYHFACATVSPLWKLSDLDNRERKTYTTCILYSYWSGDKMSHRFFKFNLHAINTATHYLSFI